MGGRILIRSSDSRLPAFLTGGFGVIFMIVGTVLGISADLLWAALAIGGVGLLLLFAGFYIESERVRQLMWITLDEAKFTVIDNIGERSFLDDDIVSIALQYKENFDNGNHKSTTRTFRVWVVASGEKPELIEMKTKIKVGEVDPLSGFINRVVTLLKDRADNELLKNQSVLGEGWELTTKSLILNDSEAGELEVPVAELDAVMLVEDRFKLWKSGEAEAFASIPITAANAHLLQLMLKQEISKRGEVPQRSQPAGHLGRLLFERKPQRGLALALLAIAVILAVVVSILVTMMLKGVKKNDLEAMVIFSVILSILSVVCVVAAWVTHKTLFHCHEFGVYQRGVSGERRLLYSEVREFTYSAVKHYHKGAYTGTHLKVIFTPDQTLNKPEMKYKATIKNADIAFEQLRDRMAEQLGPFILDRVTSGQTVEWTDSLTLEPEQLRYQPAGIFGKKPEQIIHYAQISSHSLQDITLSLFQRGKPKPFFTTTSGVKNFFPGYFAFKELWSRARLQAANIPEKEAEMDAVSGEVTE